MFALLKRSPLALFWALALHLILLYFLIFGINLEKEKPKPIKVSPQVETIKAQVIDQSQLSQSKKADIIKAATLKLKQQPLEKAQKLKAEETKKAAKAKKAREEKARKQKAEKAKKAREEKARKQKAEKAKKAREEKARQLKAKKARIAAETAAREQAMLEAMELERRESATSRENAVYRLAIKRRIERYWRKPLNTRAGLVCEVRVRLLTSGAVVSAKISRSSGSSRFDETVIKAILKADPLPKPPTNMARILKLEFKQK